MNLNDSARDAGNLTYSAFRINSSTRQLEEIKLKESGDFIGINDAPETAGLVEWLESVMKETVPAKPENVDEKPIFVQSADLIKEYRENSKAADARYKGKLLAVTGIVSGTIQTPHYSWIGVRGEGSFDLANDLNPKGVGCVFDESEKTDAGIIQTSQKMTVVGINDGMKKAKMIAQGEYIALRNCRIGSESNADQARQAKAEGLKSAAEVNEKNRLKVSLPDASTGKVPTGLELQVLLEKTIHEFADAIDSADFANFKANNVSQGSILYRVTPERLGEVFGRRSLIPELRAAQALIPKFSREPSIGIFTRHDAGKLPVDYKSLNLIGRYEGAESVLFEIQFLAEGREWKVNVINFWIESKN